MWNIMLQCSTQKLGGGQGFCCQTENKIIKKKSLKEQKGETKN